MVVLILVLMSCSSSKTPTKSTSLFEVLTQQPTGGANIQFYEILSEPREIAMLLNDDHLKKKVKLTDVKYSNFMVLNMGEKPTGGYKIGVANVEETDKNIIITVKETAPEANAMVTQGFTTPYCIVKINSKKEILVK